MEDFGADPIATHEDIDVAVERIALQALRDQRAQAVEAFAHVGRLRVGMHRDAIVMAILALVGVPASATVVGVGIALFIAGAAIQYDKVIATYQRGCVDQGDYLAGKLFGNVGLAIVGFASAFSASRQAAAAAAAEAEVASAIRNVNVKVAQRIVSVVPSQPIQLLEEPRRVP